MAGKLSAGQDLTFFHGPIRSHPAGTSLYQGQPLAPLHWYSDAALTVVGCSRGHLPNSPGPTLPRLNTFGRAVTLVHRRITTDSILPPHARVSDTAFLGKPQSTADPETERLVHTVCSFS